MIKYHTVNLISTVEKIEALKEVAWSEVLKMNDLVMNNNHRDQTQSSP